MVDEVTRIPEQIPNINEIVNDKFKLVIRNVRVNGELRNLQFFTQAVNLPGVSGTPMELASPVNPFFVAGNKLNFEELSFQFKVDEDLNNYYEVFSWMKSIYSPTEFKQYKDYQTTRWKNEWAVDASLYSLTNVFNPNIEIVFQNVFPISLSALQFDVTDGESVMKADVVFKIDSFDIIKD